MMPIPMPGPRWWLVAAVIALLAAAAADGVAAQGQGAGTRTRRQRAGAAQGSGAGRQTKPRPGFVAPGVAGAIPRKPAARPRVGPLNVPGLPPLFPAPVAPPGAPGLGGLQPRAANPLIYGINVVWGDSGGTAGWDKGGGARARRLAQLVKAGGFTSTRVGIGWADVEKRRGVYNWAETDRFIAFIRKLGITPICVVAVTPDWAVDQSPETLRLFRERGVPHLAGVRAPGEQYLPDLTRFARKAAARYKGIIRHWEFWNEPDGMGMPLVTRDPAGRPTDIRYGGDPKLYVSLLKAFSAGARKGNPEARIAVGGLQVLRTDFLEGIYANDGRAAFDAVALHPYNGANPIAFDWIDACRAVVEAHGDAEKPFWLTEWGWATQPAARDGVTEGHQARLVRECLSGIRERRFITQASYHTLNDWRTNEGDPASVISMGLATYALAPRAAFHTFRTVARGETAAPPATYAKAMLTGPPEGPGTVRVSVNPAISQGAVPELWSAFSQPFDPGIASVLERAASQVRRLGVSHVRIEALPDPDAVRVGAAGLEVDWARTDAAVAAIERIGARPVLSFGAAPPALIGAEAPARWAALAAEAARRYTRGADQRAPYWELALDPGAGGAAEAHWQAVYEAFARAVTGVDARARVGGPGRSSFDEAQLVRLARENASRSIPMHFVSWRATALSPAEVGRQVAAVRKGLDAAPGTRGVGIVLSEWSMESRADAANDGMPAALYAASLAESLAGAGPVLAFAYTLAEAPRGADTLWGGWAVLGSDGRPKAAFNVLAMLSRLRGARVQAMTEDTSVHALASRDNGGVYALVWRDEAPPDTPEEPDRPVLLRVERVPWTGATQGQVTVLDARHGNAAAPGVSPYLAEPVRFSAPAGSLEAPITVPPGRLALVELRPGPAPAATVRLSAPGYTVYPGRTAPLRVAVHNPGTQPLRATVEMAASEALPVASARDRKRQVVVPPGAESTLAFDVQPWGRGAGAREMAQVRLDAAGGGSPVWAAAALRIENALEARLASPRVDLFTPSGTELQRGATGTVRVTLDNRGGSPVEVRAWNGRAESRVKVAPGKRAEAALLVPAPSSVPGLYPVLVRLDVDGRPHAPLKAHLGVPAVCVRAPRPPRLDGDLAEWEAAQPLVPGSEGQAKGEPLNGPGDLAARVFTMWDARFLYVAAEVTDDVHYQPHAAELMWQADSLQFAIDTARDAAPDQVGYGPSDYELGVGTAPGGARVVRFHPVAGTFVGARAVVRREGERTLYEAAIPWSALGGMQPFAGGIVGLSVLVNDSDGRGRSYLEWGGGMAEGKRPGTFIGLRFAR